MNYSVEINQFEGPLDLLLHLIKQSEVDIFDIKIEEITKQYLEYINLMDTLNLDIASEYLVMAAELVEIKSSILLPKKKIEEIDEFEEDPRDNLINRLVEYEKYKKVTEILKKYEKERKECYTKNPSELSQYVEIKEEVKENFEIFDLVEALNKMLDRKSLDRPLNTKIASKEYSITERSSQIKSLLNYKGKINFADLFDVYTKDYIVITFLSILNMARHNELNIVQEKNFDNIVLEKVGV